MQMFGGKERRGGGGRGKERELELANLYILNDCVAARVHGRLRVQRDPGAAQLQHVQLGEMVDGQENVVPRIEPSRPAEEGTGQGSQSRQAVRLRAGVDSGRAPGPGGDPPKADARRPAQRPPPSQHPPRRPHPAVPLPRPPGPGEGRQGQVQVSQAEKEEEEEAEVQAGREAGPPVPDSRVEQAGPPG